MDRSMTITCDAVRDLAAGFVLGILEPYDDRAVREHLATCPEPHPEIAELGGVVPYLAESIDLVEPPAALKERVLAAGREDLASRRPAIEQSPVAAFPGPRDRRTRQAGRNGRAGPAWLVRIAAALLIVGLGGWNLLLQAQLGQSQAYERGVAAVLTIAAEPGSVTAILVGPSPDSPRGLAAVAADGRVHMAIRDLPPTSGTEVYEAWVIVGDGGPVPIGGFTVGPDRVGLLSDGGVPAEPGAVLALTREPAPGATAPTLPILASGTAIAPRG